MFTKFRSKFTYANVMATIAVFIALGGSSYAAITITGKNVKNSSLTGKDIKNSSLTTSDVKNRSLLSADFKSGQLPAGPPGAKGASGTNGATKLVVRKVITPMLIANTYYSATAPCNAGEVATGGGLSHSEGGNAAREVYDAPNSGSPTAPPTDWVGAYFNGASTIDSMSVYVVCASP